MIDLVLPQRLGAIYQIENLAAVFRQVGNDRRIAIDDRGGRLPAQQLRGEHEAGQLPVVAGGEKHTAPRIAGGGLRFERRGQAIEAGAVGKGLIRAERGGGLHDVLTEETELPGVEGGQDSALEHRDLMRAFSALPEEQRSVLLLIGVEDLSYEEAARVLGVPIGTVMSRLSRARQRLRSLVENGPVALLRRVK